MLSQILLTAMLLKSVVLSTVELFHYWILRFGCDCEFSKAMTENEEKSKRRWKAGSGGLEKRGEKGKRKNDGWNYEGMYWTHLHDKRLYSLRKVVYRLQHAENQTCCQRSWKSQKSRYTWFISNPSEERESVISASEFMFREWRACSWWSQAWEATERRSCWEKWRMCLQFSLLPLLPSFLLTAYCNILPI